MAVGAIGGAALLGGAGPTVLTAVLAFGAAALLYLVVEELLVEAYEQAETPGLAAMFFLGLRILAELGGRAHVTARSGPNRAGRIADAAVVGVASGTPVRAYRFGGQRSAACGWR